MKKVIKKSLIPLVLATSFLSLCFLSCSNVMLGVQAEKGEKATIFVSLAESRTAFPTTAIDYNTYIYTLTATNMGGTEQTVFTDKPKSELEKGFTLDLDYYTFNITAYTNDAAHKAVFEGSTIAKLKAQDNELFFNMYSVPGDIASATVTLMLPTDDSEKDIVKSVKAGVASSPFATSDNCKFIAATDIAIDKTDSANPKVVFTSNAFVTGRDQFVIFYLYDAQNEVIATIPESVVCVYGIASTSTIETNAYNLYDKTTLTINGFLQKQYYLAGEPFNTRGLTVSCSVAGRSFDIPLKDDTNDGYTTNFDSLAGCHLDLTISYRDATYTIKDTLNRSNYVFTDSPVILPAGTDGSIGTNGTYCNFGDFPQEAKDGSVSLSNDVAGNGYYIGSDGALYDLREGTYYKIEPIKWRVLNTRTLTDADKAKISNGNDYNYGPTLDKYDTINKAFLFCEKNLDGIKFYHIQCNDAVGTWHRKIDGRTIHTNSWQYSKIRAYLNCLDGSGYDEDNFTSNGFYKKAFTKTARAKIYQTSCPNDPNSNKDVEHTAAKNTPGNDRCDGTTVDKIFILSLQEATNDYYGFEKNCHNDDNAKKRVRTSYSADSSAGGNYWLRSQYYDKSPAGRKGDSALAVNGNGKPDNRSGVSDSGAFGVCPALCVSLNGPATDGSSSLQDETYDISGYLVKEYYEAGEPLDLSGITVTHTDSNGTRTNLIYTNSEHPAEGQFTTNFNSLVGANQELIITCGHSYTENIYDKSGNVTGTKEVYAVDYTGDAGIIHRATYTFHEIPQVSSHTSSFYPGTTEKPAVFYEFGDYPQAKKSSNVTLSPGKADCGYYIGTDGNYYDKLSSDFYLIEPIIWRVLNAKEGSSDNYKTTGKALLFAEHVLDAGVSYYRTDSKSANAPEVRRYAYAGPNSQEKLYAGASRTPPDSSGNSRPLDVYAYGYGVQVFANNYEYSTVRAYLNSIDSREYQGNIGGNTYYDFRQTGFLTKAFTENGRKKILREVVPNGPDSIKIAPGDNVTRSCPDTTDKVFLLSLQELTNTDYGFTNTDDTGSDDTRKRYRTNYAEGKGLYTQGGMGHYMTRSPIAGNEKSQYCYIKDNGSRAGENVTKSDKGLVPAIWVTLDTSKVPEDTDTSPVRTVPLGSAWPHAEPSYTGTFDIKDAATLFDVVGEGYNGAIKGPIIIQQGELYDTPSATNGTHIYLITLSGTETVAGQATGIWEDLQSGFNGGSAYQTNVVNAIKADIPQGSNLIISGHSLGGMIAQQVSANDDVKNNYNVLNVVTFGSPLLAEGSREGTLHRLCDLSDIVPFLSGSIFNNSDKQWLDRDVEDGGYGEEIRDSGGMTLHFAGAAGDQRDTTGPHCDSYHRPNVWGTINGTVLYDATGQKGGSKWIRTDMTTKKFYANPS